MNRLFVYGTLMQAQARADLLKRVRSVKPASTSGRMYHLRPGYPALVDDGDGVVHGELVSLDDLAAQWATLDAYEGDLYRRIEKRVCVGASECSAWCYVVDAAREPALLAAGAVLVPGGLWEPRSST